LPELGQRPEQGAIQCTKPARIVQRGSANLHIAELVTALTILDIPARLHDLLVGRSLLSVLATLDELGLLDHNMFLSRVKAVGLSGADVEYLATTPWHEVRPALDQLLSAQPVGPDSVRNAELDRLRDAAEHGAPARTHPNAVGSPPMFAVRQADVLSVSGPTGRLTFRVAPINRLRMVITQKGYRRLSPDAGYVVPTSFKYNGITWYPGVEQFGEGIFIDLGGLSLGLSGRRVEPWYTRYRQSSSFDPVSHPIHVWWHGLSHRLLWALSVDSGYSAAAIRERVYARVEDGEVTNSGLLLYTVQPGGDGTLGGLISLVNRFDRVLDRAFQDLDTCSNDPLCEEAPAAGADGAACYSCLFASETSCEHRNHGLDRLLLTDNLP
jgi:hypothetical protein